MRKTVALIISMLAATSVARAQCPDGTPPPCRGTRAQPPSLAVLYFDLLSSDSADTYLADGLTEQLIVRLGQLPRLTVKSRFEVQRFRGRRLTDAAGVARGLNAGYLVTGSLRKSGTRVVVTAELLRAGLHPERVWGDVFDRRSTDVLDIESAIAVAVAGAVAGQLDPAERTALARRPTRDPEAYLLYQHGRALFSRALAGVFERDLRAADAFFDAALERDSMFAAAWAAKAEIWAWMSDQVVPGTVGYARVRRYATRALALDSTLAAAHAWLAPTYFTLDRNWNEAEAQARRAIALDPNGYPGWLTLAVLEWCQGRIAESDSAMMRAWQADSLSSAVQWLLSTAFTVGRHYTEMRAFAERMEAAGLTDAAADLRITSLSFLAPDSALRFRRGDIEFLARAGRLAEARDSLRAYRARTDSLVRVGAQTLVIPDQMAELYSAVGDLDEAFYWINRAIDAHSGGPVSWLKVYPGFDNLRGDPRYREALRRLNLL